MAKQYGLIVPNKDKDKVVRRPAIFGDDSDSDDGPQKPTGLKNTLKKQDKINQQKVLDEDPTVYQYDEIYDEMDQKRKESKLSRKDLDRKPKYISRLLAAADRRKKENERRIERQIQKERETEGDEFKDKEAFITGAYKKKLEELKEIEEQEKREEYLESIGDVTKQVNLDGFYRHLYDQKVNNSESHQEDKGSGSGVEKPEQINKPEKIYRSRTSSDDSESNSDNEKEKLDDTGTSKKVKRKYRSRKSSEKSEEGEIQEVEDIKKEHLPSNLDADSDFSIDSSDSEDENDKGQGKKDPSEGSQEVKTEEKPTIKEEVIVENKEENQEPEPQPKKPKIDIWKKRTVGEVFDAALKRYFERKAVATY